MPRRLNFHDENLVLIFYEIYSSFLFCVMLLLYPYAIYLIAFRSPSPMQVYRKFLLAITTSDFVYSFALNFLNQPVPVFPAFGGLSLGFAGYFGHTWIWVSFCLTIIATVGTIFAQCYSLVYRFVIFKSTLRLMNLFNRKITHFTLCGYCIFATIVIIIGVMFIRADPKIFHEKASTISMIPIRDSDEVFGFNSSTDGLFHAWMAFVVFNLCFAIAGSFVFLYLIFNILTSRVSHMSKNTVKIQWNFAKASFIQLLLPIIFLYFPALFCGFQLTLGFLKSEILLYISIYLLNTYSVANTCVTIFYISSYRKQTIFLLQKLFSCVPKWRKSSVTSNLTIVSCRTEPPGVAAAAAARRSITKPPKIVVTKSF